MSPFACFPNLVIFSSLELQRCLAIVVENSNRGKFRSTPSIENPNIVSYFAEVQYDHALYFQIFKCLLLVLGSLLLSTSVLATNVGGNIPTSTWTAAGNPYVMVANAYVASDNTLQIETGVQIQSPSGFSFGVDSGVGLSAMLLLWVHAIWTGDADVL